MIMNTAASEVLFSGGSDHCIRQWCNISPMLLSSSFQSFKSFCKVHKNSLLTCNKQGEHRINMTKPWPLFQEPMIELSKRAMIVLSISISLRYCSMFLGTWIAEKEYR
jgi:hypothetical protein